jgi:hypothetical protein
MCEFMGVRLQASKTLPQNPASLQKKQIPISENENENENENEYENEYEHVLAHNLFLVHVLVLVLAYRV